MGDIDEISQALGAIQSDVSNVKEHVKETRDFMAAINLKLGDMNTQHVLMAAKVDAAHSRIDAMNIKVEKHDGFISKIIWLGTALVTGITVVLNWVGPFLGRFFT